MPRTTLWRAIATPPRSRQLPPLRAVGKVSVLSAARQKTAKEVVFTQPTERFSAGNRSYATPSSGPDNPSAGSKDECISINQFVARVDVFCSRTQNAADWETFQTAVRPSSEHYRANTKYYLPEDPTPDHIDIHALGQDRIFYSTFHVEGKMSAREDEVLGSTLLMLVQPRWRFIRDLVTGLRQMEGVVGIEVCRPSVAMLDEMLKAARNGP